jgi:hypothetical protein
MRQEEICKEYLDTLSNMDDIKNVDSEEEMEVDDMDERQFSMKLSLSTERTKQLSYMLEIRKLDFEIKKLECQSE